MKKKTFFCCAGCGACDLRVGYAAMLSYGQQLPGQNGGGSFYPGPGYKEMEKDVEMRKVAERLRSGAACSAPDGYSPAAAAAPDSVLLEV